MADEVTWVQCEACDKWRRVPHLTPDQVPDEWYCSMNQDPLRDSCDAPEEDPDAPAPVVLPPGQFEVEVLLARRRDPRTKRFQYKVRWKGFDDPAEDTWEDERNIMHPGCARPAPPSAACAEPAPTHAPARPTPPGAACPASLVHPPNRRPPWRSPWHTRGTRPARVRSDRGVRVRGAREGGRPEGFSPPDRCPEARAQCAPYPRTPIRTRTRTPTRAHACTVPRTRTRSRARTRTRYPYPYP